VRGNLFTANFGAGVDMFLGGNTNTIENNTITGNGIGGVEDAGVRVISDSNTIQRNIVTNNSGSGIMVINDPPTNPPHEANLISQNVIFNNGKIGIDLHTGAEDPALGTNPYVTPNDAGDTDGGANQGQNYPVLTSAGSSGGNTWIAGTFNSTASTTFTLEFFSSTAADPSGNGEGEVYLGSDTVTTDGTGNATINTVLAVAVAVGDVITATATDPADNTSEFSNAVIVVEATDLYVAKTVDNSTPNESATITYTITVTNNGPAQATTIVVTDLLPAGVTYSSDTPSQGAYVSGTGVWTVGTINSGASATLDIQATVDAGTSGSTITNNVTAVSLDQLDNNVTADDLSEDITVVSPNVTLSKSADRATAKPTEVITYTLTYGNTGTGDATNLVITDTIPANTTLVSGSITGGGTESGGVITWNLGVLRSPWIRWAGSSWRRIKTVPSLRRPEARLTMDLS
jgi:uncharacterized repeat protein (TIGR01451 family)